MALFGKYDDRPARPDDATALMPAAPQPARAKEADDVQAHLARGSRVVGKLHFDGSVRIDGHVEGEIEAQDSVLIGESAVVVAQISAGTVIAMGHVTGDVNARQRAELRAPARLLGNIVTPNLIIQEGVVFEGHCSMAGADAAENTQKEKKLAVVPPEDRPNVRAVSDVVK